MKNVQILNFLSKVRFWIKWRKLWNENCTYLSKLDEGVLFGLAWLSNVLGLLRVPFHINESILWEKVEKWLVFSIEILKTINGLSYLEFIKFNKRNCFIFFVMSLVFLTTYFSYGRKFCNGFLAFWVTSGLTYSAWIG